MDCSFNPDFKVGVNKIFEIFGFSHDLLMN